MSKVSVYQIEEMQQWAHLNIPNIIEYMDHHSPTYNGFFEHEEDPYPKVLLEVMTNPNYFYFVCKSILNIEILPFQAAILRELWIRPFPMLVGCRGLGKCVHGDTLVLSNSGIKRISDVVGDAEVQVPKVDPQLTMCGENGFKNVEYSWNNGVSKTIKVKTRYGYDLEGTPDHPVRAVRNGKIEWIKLEDLRLGDSLVVSRKEQWFDNTNDLTEDEAYMFGLLVSDGGYTVRGRISFTTADECLVESISDISERLFGKRFVRMTSKTRKEIQYNLYGVEIWDALFQKYGFNSPVCDEKDVPSSVMQAPKNVMRHFLMGLFDGDGGLNKTGAFQYCSKSEKLVSSIHFILTLFGIVSKKHKRLNKKYNRWYHYITISDVENLQLLKEKIGFKLPRKQEKFKDLKSNTNIDIIPKELVQEDLLNLIAKYKKSVDVIEHVHGYSYTRQMLAPSRIKAYGTTYPTLRKILSLTESISHEPEWQKINKINEDHYFYDPIVSLEESENQTFDVHIPDDHSFLTNGLISHNTFILAVYATLRCLLCPGAKVVMVGAAFRQSKLIYEYMAHIWANAPLLRDICQADRRDNKQGPRSGVDSCQMFIGNSWALAIPIGDGGKIRGLRAHYILADEFSSQSEAVYENVVAGFASVSATPIDNVKNKARQKVKEKFEEYIKESSDDRTDYTMKSNQAVLSGTAYYSFNHFAKYWERYRKIINSKGDRRLLAEIFGGNVPEDFDWRDYCVIRIPYHLLPAGFMDDKHISRSRLTVHTGIFQMEMGAVFTTDSNGFFKRSLVESCVVSNQEGKEIIVPSVNGPVMFNAVTRGDPNKQYVYGIDPASEHDRFSIVVLEVWPDHNRIVYVWTTTRAEHKQKLSSHFTTEQDYYGFCVRKIRELMRVFPCAGIALDSQGGGFAIEEGLHDPDKVLDNTDKMIWQIIEPDKEKPTDHNHGLHILHMINFASAEWTAKANHGMRKDFESKTLLFPFFDPMSIDDAIQEDKKTNRIYDTLEDCVMEIEELKDELATIVHTQTATSGRDRWDTPEIKLAGGKKGRQRKDRYSALLMANAIAREIYRTPIEPEYNTTGGFVSQINQVDRSQKPSNGPLYDAPPWFNYKLPY